MRTPEQIKEKAIINAMCHVFSGLEEDNDTKAAYESLLEQAEKHPDNQLEELEPWEPFEYRSAQEILDIVDGLIDCFERVMKWAQEQPTE